MSSCFLLAMQSDSIDGIYETLKQSALISKGAGGYRNRRGFAFCFAFFFASVFLLSCIQCY
jgi:hypothetical protein